MDEEKQGASQPASDTSKEAERSAPCGEGMKEAMAEMMENCGCCEEMIGMISRGRRPRRTPESPAAKA